MHKVKLRYGRVCMPRTGAYRINVLLQQLLVIVPLHLRHALGEGVRDIEEDGSGGGAISGH